MNAHRSFRRLSTLLSTGLAATAAAAVAITCLGAVQATSVSAGKEWKSVTTVTVPTHKEWSTPLHKEW